jgi:hypothetical protein
MPGIDHNFQKIKYEQFGPWRNAWGYTTTIACFDDNDIIVKTETPYNTRLTEMFDDWESCEEFIELIEQDRRF